MVIRMIHSQHFDVYAASCAEDGGIVKYEFSKGQLKYEYKIHLDRPMYLEIKNDIISATLREAYGENSGFIRIKDNKNAFITTRPPQNTFGKCAAHFCTVGDAVYCANYLSGSVIKIPDKVVFHSGHGKNRDRQAAPHPHFICETPDSLLLVCDLGTDKIIVYTRELEKINEVTIGEGRGPRHLVVDKQTGYIYCANELSSSVTVLEYKEGYIHVLGEYSTLFKNNAENFPAAIRLYDNMVFVSNRGDNSVSIFKIYGDSLELCTVTPCGGIWPRDINIFGGYLLCANEMSDDISVFKIEKETLKNCSSIKLKNPVCIVGRTIGG